jgi:hypothetical protein
MVIFPGGDVRNAIRPNVAPMLWHDREQPDPTWCRNNDWWMKRGTQDLKIFNQLTNEFQATVPKSGIDYPVLSFLEEDDPNAPKIVP